MGAVPFRRKRKVQAGTLYDWCYLRTWCGDGLGRFEPRHSTSRASIEFALEPTDESIGCNAFSTWFNVCFFPSFHLYSFHLPRLHQRLQTSPGNSASVATIARIPYVHRLEALDFFYANNEILTWSIVEVGISIIATAAATIRPLLAKTCFFPLLTQRSTNRYISANNRCDASRTEWSGFGEGFATSSFMSGGQCRSHSASGWLTQHTRVGSISEEGQKSNPSSSEEQTLNWDVEQANVTVTAIESHLELGELEVPKSGIQKTVKISQSSF
jgi:hypothetical protein